MPNSHQLFFFFPRKGSYSSTIHLGNFLFHRRVTLTYIREARNERSHRNFSSSLGNFSRLQESRKARVSDRRFGTFLKRKPKIFDAFLWQIWNREKAVNPAKLSATRNVAVKLMISVKKNCRHFDEKAERKKFGINKIAKKHTKIIQAKWFEWHYNIKMINIYKVSQIFLYIW